MLLQKVQWDSVTQWLLQRLQTDLPYLVRRKAKALPGDLQQGGDKAHQIDWKGSVLLNLVTQTTYSLTVSACRREHLQSIGGNQTLGKDVVQVSWRDAYAASSSLLLTSTAHFLRIAVWSMMHRIWCTVSCVCCVC